MKKSHIWDELIIVQVKCPHCRRDLEYQSGGPITGDRLRCYYCGKKFELGEQR